MATDDELLRGSAQGDDEAFAVFYRRYLDAAEVFVIEVDR